MNNKIQLVVSVIFACLTVGATLPQVPIHKACAQETITVVDSIGNKVEVPYPTERVASLNPSAMEVICILGAEDKVVGIDQYAKWNTEFFFKVKDRPSIGVPMGLPPSYEKILDLRPQVIISCAHPLVYYPDLENRLKHTDIKVLRMDFNTPDTFAQETDTLARILGKEEKAKEFLDYVESYANTITERVKDIPPEKKVKVYSELFMPYVAWGKGTGVDKLITMAGGINISSEWKAGKALEFIFPQESYESPMVNPEAIIKENPQMIFKEYMNPMDYLGFRSKPVGYTSTPNPSVLKETRDGVMNRPGFKNIDAVKNEKVYIVPAFMEISCSPRWPIYLCYLAKIFYPDLFQDVDPKSFHKEWLEKWNGLEYKGVFIYPEE